jgi:hypothetical protein
MVGYKIAFHEERLISEDVFTGLHYESTILKIPVLVVLDIPDGAKTSTPENRYTEENMNKIRYVRNMYLLETSETSALIACNTYLAYKDKDPITIYNEFLKNYDARVFEYVHSVKCRCNIAKVVDIVGIFNGMHYRRARSLYDPDFIYELYGTVQCDDFTRYNHMAVCAAGIHYFEYPVFAMLYMLVEMKELLATVRGGDIDASVAEYLTEELNTLKREGDIDERT